MPYVEPLKPENIRDPELLELLRRGEALGVPDSLFPRILAHAPGHAKALLRALLVSHAEGNVDHRLKEIIRVRLARIAGDPYFARLRSKRAQQDGLDEEMIETGSKTPGEDPRFTPAERWALRYAHEMYLNPERVDAAFYDEGKKHYTEAQIMELGAFIAFHYGMQAFMRTLGALPLAEQSDGRRESREVK
jgi:alkylhydroperoxidase family enzyme